ncbi:MAG: ATP-binding protein [bacterium]
MYIRRTLEESIKKANKSFPILLVTGPRQVGKTTVLKKCEEKTKRKYVTLDNTSDRILAKEDPQLFLQRYEPPVLIDEIQYAPELFSAIKCIVDREKKNGLYWLTGSQQFHLMKNISESLAGRVAILNLQGISQRERFSEFNYDDVFTNTKKALRQNHKVFDLNELYNIIWRGYYPALCLSNTVDWEMFYSSYLQTYLERDVRDFASISNELVFLKFMRALAARTGQLLNYSDISSDIGVSSPTVKTWISILQASGIIYLLEPYYSNITSRMTKMSKIYFLDTGLACYLTNWQSSNILETGAMNGAMLETYVVSEIIKSFWHRGKRAPIFFYRDKEKREIDVIIEYNGKLMPVEIKKKSSPTKADIKNFNALDRSGKRDKGFMVCLTSDYFPITENVIAIPVGYL